MRNSDIFEIRHDFWIESSRHLPHLPAHHPCHSLHGHSFCITLIGRGPLNDCKWVVDFDEIKSLAKPFIDQLDHKILNSVEGLELPTSELICKWLYDHLKGVWPQLYQIRIAETRDTSCAFPAH